MQLQIETTLEYKLGPGPTTILLQIEAASLPEQTVLTSELTVPDALSETRVPAEEAVGERSWIEAGETFNATYTAKVDLNRTAADLAQFEAPHLPDLPGEIVKYLMPSRYCVPSRFVKILEQNFEGLSGGALIAACRDWIEEHLDYVPGVSDENTMASDTYLARQGICRDYAHVLIALARAADIPARFASVYAPSVEPPDFHAVAEVYLGGAWHLVDPTGMAQADEMAVIGVGRDAADVAFMNIHGMSELVSQNVSVKRA
ncbi:transglutaminase-like domain-containing protein [Amaricoccus macauensis]|uniref:transglutaminase-like domain-containing protein n=1 Tax=Amaricoccus macauensis TaxID=57001 RepID=UPI003C79F22D